jgi:endo-1,4-beta-xylanase
MVHGTIDSPSMKRKIGFNIYLPPGYKDSKKKYPVVYFLHGASGSERSAGQFGDLVSKSIADKTIGEVIYVFPNGGHYSRYRDWKTGNVKAETYIIKELIPHIDKTYRTIGTREGRAITGFSMGGEGSLRLALKYPDLFCAAVPIAAAVDWGREKDGSPSAADIAKKNKEQLSKVGLLLICGKDDRLYRSNEKIAKDLKALGVKHEFVTLDGVAHDLRAIKKELGAKIVKMLASHYAAAK